MAKNSDSFSLSIPKESIAYTSISKDKSGYNSATVVAKTGENEYVRVSYEWAGDKIPGFVMDMMGYMKANKIEVGHINEEDKQVIEEFLTRDKERV